MAVTTNTCETPAYSFIAEAWLPPDSIEWYQVAKYGLFIILGAWLWDITLALGEEFNVFKRHLCSIPNAVYTLSRILTFGTILLAIIFISGASIPCIRAFQALAWLGAFAVPANAALFLLRAKGVYGRSSIATAVFTFLWLTTFASMTLPFGATASNVGPTPFCVINTSDRYSGVGFVTITVFDTSIFIAITFRILSYTVETTWKARFGALIKGQGIGQISRTLLQTGQLYYFVTTCVTLASTVVTLGALGPPQFQGMILVLNVALQNAMACKVYRILRLELSLDSSTCSRGSTGASTLNFADASTLQNVYRTT